MKNKELIKVIAIVVAFLIVLHVICDGFICAVCIYDFNNAHIHIFSGVIKCLSAPGSHNISLQHYMRYRSKYNGEND